MKLFKDKKHKVKFHNPKKLLLFCHSALLPLCLSGCMGVYEGGFECPPGEGVGCKSISEVNEMVEQCSVPGIQCSNIGSEIWYAPDSVLDSASRNQSCLSNTIYPHVKNIRKMDEADAQDSI